MTVDGGGTLRHVQALESLEGGNCVKKSGMGTAVRFEREPSAVTVRVTVSVLVELTVTVYTLVLVAVLV